MRAGPQKVPDTGEMQPVRPEAIHELFEEYVNDGDLECVADLYEPDAVLVERDGKMVSGATAIKKYLGGLFSMKPRIRIHPTGMIDAEDIAVLVSEWEMTCTGPDGSSISDSGRTYDIARRQEDGTWRIAVDNPWGAVLPKGS